MFFGHDNSFWTAVLGAAVVRLITAEYEGPWWARFVRGAATAFMAVFAAVFFTRPLMHLLGLPEESFLVPMAAMIALTGEGLMRLIIRLTADSNGIAEIFRIWRGK